MSAAAATPTLAERLLDAMLDHPERAAELTAQLYASCARQKAVLVLDMCGFSRITQSRGVLAFLLMIRRMRRICEPCFARQGGELLRGEADNLFYFFDSAAAAVAGARAALAALEMANRSLPAADHLFCAIGIGWGEVLCLSGCNVHGNEVNLAFKLGEDIAREGQILLTENAFAALGGSVPAQHSTETISGIDIPFYLLQPPPSAEGAD